VGAGTGGRAVNIRSLRVIAGRVLLTALVVLGLVFSVATSGLVSLPFDLPFAAVGAVLIVRRPHNAIGWLLLVIAACEVVGGMQVQGPAGPLVVGTAPMDERLIAWLSAVTIVPIFLCCALLAVVFPSGRLPVGRWGRLMRVLIAVNVLFLLAGAIGPTVSVSMADGSTINAANPLAVLPASWGFLGGPAFGIVLLTLLLAVGSMLVRLRQAQGLERLQFRWVVASLVLSGGGLLIAAASGLWPLAFLCFATIPLAVGIAVLRYHLYEIDRLISRTLAYSLVTVMLVAIFGASILLLQALLSPLTGGNTLAVAGSTLLVAALFQPVRRRVQAVVDRRFNRRRYDAQVAVAAFSERLRDEVDLGGIRAEILGTAHSTLQPATASIWLRGEHQPGQG
jgi:hypothetical protein